MTTKVQRTLTILIAVLCSLWLPVSWAQPRPVLTQGLIMATTCMSCHGPNGKSMGVGFVINNRPAKDIYAALLDFKTDKRRGSVMPQVAKGFTEAELALIAQEFEKLN